MSKRQSLLFVTTFILLSVWAVDLVGDLFSNPSCFCAADALHGDSENALVPFAGNEVFQLAGEESPRSDPIRPDSCFWCSFRTTSSHPVGLFPGGMLSALFVPTAFQVLPVLADEFYHPPRIS
jgi:hypothetical protein